MFDTHQCSKYESSREKILKRKDRHERQGPQDPQDQIFSRGKFL